MRPTKEGAHGKGVYGERTQRDLLGGVNLPTKNSRKPLMSGQGLFDAVLPTTSQVLEQKPTEPHRKLWFRKGTRIYSLNFPVPRTVQEAEDRLVEVLDEPQDLVIDESSLKFSKRLGKWTPVPKEQHKTRRFGAFILVEHHIQQENGEVRVIKGFASLKDRQTEENNEFAKFKKATQP